MGEVADAMVNGDLCEVCGVYLGEGNGYPRQCKHCKGEEKDSRRGAKVPNHMVKKGKKK